MSRHEGVSCDSCMKSNFRGKRYKCLICYDYDLCATCYEAGATTTRHTVDHPMQCILTRTDFDLYYGGEALTAEQPQAFTCPYCGKMGYTEASLQEHVTDHADTAIEVVCPVCAALPGGDPNHVTDDFPAHLTLEHRAPREFQDEPIGGMRHVRRIPHPGRGMGGQRARRTNMHFQSAGSALSGLSPSSRETTMDPIAELLSQLSNVRSRAAAAQNVSSQLQQLEMQLQSTRQDGRLELTMLPLGFSRQSLSRQQLEKLPRRQAEAVSKGSSGATQQAATVIDLSSSGAGSSGSTTNSQYLLARFGESDLTESERQSSETERADRSLFVQELLLSTLAEGLRLDDGLPDSPLLTSLYPAPLDESDSQPEREPEPPVGGGAGGGGGSSGGGSGGGGGSGNPPSGGSGGPPGHTGKEQHPGQASSGGGGGGGGGAGMGAGAGAGIGMGATSALAGPGGSHPAAGVSGGGVGGSGAATNAPPPRSDRRDRPTGSHRNMVKRLESNKKLEKEPPPVMKPRVSHH